jgi:hypothetical protein
MTDQPDRPKGELMSLEEATISSMWEIADILRGWDRLRSK